MSLQHMLKQYFDENKQLKKVCTAVIFNDSKWEEQQDNKLILTQEVKLRCGTRHVNTLWGPESKIYNKILELALLISAS